ncbi:hypothetical protein CHU98_g5056 [Xylaria longipes]|nr:hypothetical protein CHU98_g5056 [Xylaria longipes]
MFVASVLHAMPKGNKRRSCTVEFIHIYVQQVGQLWANELDRKAQQAQLLGAERDHHRIVQSGQDVQHARMPELGAAEDVQAINIYPEIFS